MNELMSCADSAPKSFVDQFIQATEPLLVQLGKALEVGNRVTVGRIAHSIKESSDQLGGRRLALTCDRLETRASEDLLSEGQTDLKDVQNDYLELRTALAKQLSSQVHLALSLDPDDLQTRLIPAASSPQCLPSSADD